MSAKYTTQRHETRHILDLSTEEFVTLCAVLTNVGGSPHMTLRRHIDTINEAIGLTNNTGLLYLGVCDGDLKLTAESEAFLKAVERLR